ncbi:N-formylglutamate amidohydrolase [Ferrovibrio sp.]|uniref:N-formylglutamate amidohydrolase n=1 Tax=Ferrovibrio sp. TaxID=1917215 RepID=UPI00311FED4E
MIPSDPPVFRLLNPGGHAPVVLICDHASHAVPAALHNLGLPPAELRRHIGWDPGTAAITEALSASLDAPAVLAGYSRLLIDCNRRLDEATLICESSDGTPVPGNRAIDAAERQRRIDAYYRPYHDEIDRVMAAACRRHAMPALLSIHSFTPQMRSRPVDRPWDVGVVWDRDDRLAAPLLQALRDEGDLVVGDNEPYSGRTESGVSILRHGQDRGLHHVMVELRQDRVETAAGAAEWAARLDRCFRRMLAAAGIAVPVPAC